LTLFKGKARLNEIYMKVQEFCKSEIPEIAEKFPASIGFGVQ
jgi:hypothetical protein